jgi:hypothetical protein
MESKAERLAKLMRDLSWAHVRFFSKQPSKVTPWRKVDALAGASSTTSD